MTKSVISDTKPIDGAKKDETFQAKFAQNLYENFTSPRGNIQNVKTGARNQDITNRLKGKSGVAYKEDNKLSVGQYMNSNIERNLFFGIVFYTDDNDDIVGTLVYGLDNLTDSEQKNGVIAYLKTLILKKTNMSGHQNIDFSLDILDAKTSNLDDKRFYSERLLKVKYLEFLCFDAIKFLGPGSGLIAPRPIYRNCAPSKIAYYSADDSKNYSQRPKAPVSENIFQAGRSSHMRGVRNLASLK